MAAPITMPFTRAQLLDQLRHDFAVLGVHMVSLGVFERMLVAERTDAATGRPAVPTRTAVLEQFRRDFYALGIHPVSLRVFERQLLAEHGA